MSASKWVRQGPYWISAAVFVACVGVQLSDAPFPARVRICAVIAAFWVPAFASWVFSCLHWGRSCRSGVVERQGPPGVGAESVGL